MEAPLIFLASRDDPALYIASVGGGEVKPHQGNYIAHTMPIHNARLRKEAFDLDREGFMLVPQPTLVRDFYNDAEIERIYENEVKKLVRNATGAARVEIFDHTRRATSEELRKDKLIREPASTVHNDYSDAAGPDRVREHFPNNPDEAQALINRRFAIINVWRSIAGTVLRKPLALCDAGSVAAEDLVTVTRQAKDRVGELQLAMHNPSHRWFYYPEMERNEALLIKTYDSANDGRARFTIHTAFDDPNSAPDAPPRESIETRCFAFF